MRTQDLVNAAAGAIAATALVGGVALTTNPSGDSVIQGCSNTKLFGALRVIDPSRGQQCAAFEIPISWNQRGPAGGAGAQGASGAKGDDGRDGVSVTSVPEQPGPNCRNGGSRFTSASGVSYACNGVDGTGGGSPGHDVVSVFGTGGVTVTSATNLTSVPGLTATMDVPPNSVLYVSTDGGMQNTSSGADAYSVVDFGILVDGVFSGSGRRVIAANTGGVRQAIANWSFATTLTLAPGSHTIAVAAVGVDPGAAPANVSGTASQIQGVLHVLTIVR